MSDDNEILTRQQVNATRASLALARTDVLAELHEPVDPHAGSEHAWNAGRWWKCHGCDQGCSCDSPDWPCSSAILIAHAHDIELYDCPVRWADVIRRAKEDA